MTQKLIRYGSSNTCRLNYDNDNGEMAYITFDILDKTEIVDHFFSTRLGGVSSDCLASLNFGYNRGDKKENVDENFRRAAAHMGMESSDIVCSMQTHTTNVMKVTAADKGKGVTIERDYTDVDALITNERGIILATFFADCVPLFIVDPWNKAIGLAHSGWRGTIGKIGAVTLEKMAKEYGTKQEVARVVIAPSICQKCYEVDEDVAMQFEKAFPLDIGLAYEYLKRFNDKTYISRQEIDECLLQKKENGKYLLNLWYANFRVLRECGVANKNIAITDVCTCCNSDILFSHRATNGKRGNLGAFMMLKKEFYV